MKKNYITDAYLKILLVFVFFFGIIFNSPELKAQEPLFTQFDYNPLVINPANTGNFNGDWRIAGNLRNQMQGVGDYRTTTISYDRQIYILNQRIGAGIYLMNDESGANVNKMAYNKAYGSLAYQATIKNSSVGFGVQVGFATGKKDSWTIYDGLTGSHTAPSGEPDSYGSSGFVDVNVGLNYKTSISIFQPEIGISALHVNKPDKSFYNDGTAIESMAYIGNLLLRTNLNDNLYISPKILFMNMASESATIAGLEGGYNAVGRSQVKRIFAGSYLRNGLLNDNRIIVVQAGATVNRIDLVFNYELPSSVSSSGSLGAFEISFIYKSISTVLNSYSIPCERY